MQVIDFSTAHLEQAAHIAMQNYEAEREHAPSLPSVEAMPDLAPYAQNGLGVAAVDEVKHAQALRFS